MRAIRIIGRDCIIKRIKVIESGAEVPNDTLTHIVQVACKLSSMHNSMYSCITAIVYYSRCILSHYDYSYTREC